MRLSFSDKWDFTHQQKIFFTCSSDFICFFQGILFNLKTAKYQVQGEHIFCKNCLHYDDYDDEDVDIEALCPEGTRRSFIMLTPHVCHFLYIPALLTFLSEKTSFWGGSMKTVIYRNSDICKLICQPVKNWQNVAIYRSFWHFSLFLLLSLLSLDITSFVYHSKHLINIRPLLPHTGCA